MKYGQIWMKKYAERSEAKKKTTEQLKEGLKSSILGPQNLGSGGARAPRAPPLDPLVFIPKNVHIIVKRIILLNSDSYMWKCCTL